MSQDGHDKNPVSVLFEYATRQSFPKPTFLEISNSGPPHLPHFTTKAQFVQSDGNVIVEATGVGRTKKLAKTQAAVALLANIKNANINDASKRPVIVTKELSMKAFSISQKNDDNQPVDQQQITAKPLVPELVKEAKSMEKPIEKSNSDVKPLAETNSKDKLIRETNSQNDSLDKPLEESDSGEDSFESINSEDKPLEDLTNKLNGLSIDKSENDFLELSILVEGCNLEEFFRKLACFNVYRKLEELEKKFEGLKVTCQDYPHVHKGKIMYTYYVYYKTRLITNVFLVGPKDKVEKTKEQAARKAYQALKISLTNYSVMPC